MRYRGFVITSCPDGGIRRQDPDTGSEEICKGFYCQVYPADDDQYAHRLSGFCLAEGYEIPDLKEGSLCQGIVEYVDSTYKALKAGKERAIGKRQRDLLGRAVCWISGHGSGRETYGVLSEMIGMTDDGIRELGVLSLVPYFNREAYAQTIAEYLIETGMENTTSGNWNFAFEEINERYAVNLPDDQVLLEDISRHLSDCSGAVADLCVTDEGVDLDFYYGLCPNYCSQIEAEGSEDDVCQQI